MTLFLVSEASGAPVWVAKLLDDDMFVYDHHTEQFHANEGLWKDYYFDQTLTFTPIDADRARTAITEKVGWYDARAKRWLHKQITEAKAISTAEALGTPPVPSSAQRLARRVADLTAAAPGVAITWATYEPSKKASAYMTASNLRRGKVAAVRATELVVDARVVTSADGSCRVDVWRVH